MVLVVEDDPTAGEALAHYVERVPGFSVVGHVRSGAEALQRLSGDRVDLVMMDIYLPDMSGLDVLRRMRWAGNMADVVAVTRARDLSVVRAAASFGATQYLLKPFTFATVRQRIAARKIRAPKGFPNRAERRIAVLESVLGATPRGFESRILRQPSPSTADHVPSCARCPARHAG